MTVAGVSLTCILAASAMAATQWNFGASLRYATFWTEADFGKDRGTDIQGGGAPVGSDGNLSWSKQGNSRFKAFMKSDKLEGYIEMGLDYDNNNRVYTRQYWGKYKFNDNLAIQIGQMDHLFTTIGLSNQVWSNDLAMHGIGTSHASETPAIVLRYGNFSFGMFKPYDGRYEGSNTDIDSYLPQLQASYQYRGDAWRFKLSGAYQHLAMNDFNGGSKDRDIHSWLVAVDGDMYFGPLYLAATVSAGQNWADARWNTNSSISDKYAQNKVFDQFGAIPNSSNKVEDTTSVMAAFIVGYQMTEDLRFEGGFGYRYDDNDMYDDASHIFNGYLQARYYFAPGFFIAPEVGYIDLGDTHGMGAGNKSRDAGYIWYAGAQWRMDF